MFERSSVAARSLCFIVTASCVALASRSAHAIRPDFDGERGVEAQVAFGVGGFANGTQRIFIPANTAGVSAQPVVVGPGFNVRAALGYRITPALSVGASFTIGPQGAFALNNMPSPESWTYGASTFAVGGYARLYVLALTKAIPRTTRVEFDSWGAARRWDPWISLGVEYQSVQWSQTLRASPNVNASLARASASVPVGLGVEYRVIPMLAVGVTSVLSPTFGAGVFNQNSAIVLGNLVTMTNTFTAEDPVNLFWSVGLSARYTLTL